MNPPDASREAGHGPAVNARQRVASAVAAIVVAALLLFPPWCVDVETARAGRAASVHSPSGRLPIFIHPHLDEATRPGRRVLRAHVDWVLWLVPAGAVTVVAFAAVLALRDPEGEGETVETGDR